MSFSTARKCALTVLGMAVIVFLVIFFFPVLDKNKNTALILITTSGFSPDTLFIPLNTTVTWRNIDNRDHWPAGDYHPTHSLYPQKTENDCLGSAFDACRPLAPGEEWSFTFTHGGEWTYHDHLFPSLGGTIHVGEKENSKSIMDGDKMSSASLPKVNQFSSLSSNEQRSLIHSAALRDPLDAWTYLKQAYKTDGQLESGAHQLAHIFANAAYLKEGFSSINICDPTFAYGCYHGVVEQMLITEGVGGIRKAVEKCEEFFPIIDRPDIRYSSCIHGIGHGVATWENLMLGPALEQCRASTPAYARQYCYDGVFMEYSFAKYETDYNDTTSSLTFNLCSSLETEYQKSCIRYAVFESAQHGFQDLNITCSVLQDNSLQDGCIESFGLVIAQTYPFSPKKIADACTQFDVHSFTCVKAAAGEIVFQQYSQADENAERLCDTLIGAERTACREYVSTIQESQIF